MKKSKRNSTAPHVRIYFAMMESPAWKSVSSTAHDIYLEMLKEYRGRPENRFSLSYSQLQDQYRFGKSRISAALRALERFGFIDVLEKGGLYKAWSEYALSERWKTAGAGGAPPKPKEELPQSPEMNGKAE